jgi:hypothetical protein
MISVQREKKLAKNSRDILPTSICKWIALKIAGNRSELVFLDRSSDALSPIGLSADWFRAYSVEYFSRLRQIKSTYDPGNVRNFERRRALARCR